MSRMHSREWFDTFAATVPASIIEIEIAAISELLPRSEYPRVLDVGCGIEMVWGGRGSRPGADLPRYRVVCVRP